MLSLDSIKKDKKLYKRALQIAWPSVLESLFISLAGMIDTLMVSSLGAYAIAAVGLTVQAKFISLSAFFALNTAVSALVARRKGAEDKKGANEVFKTAFIVAMIVNLIMTTFFLYFSDTAMEISGSNPDTHTAAVEYFRIIIGGQLFNVIAMTINSAQRGAGNTKIAFTTNMISSIVNVIFNYLLIGGNLGFPALGIKGAAYATVLGTIVASILSIYSLFNKDSLIQVRYIVNEKIKSSKEALKSIFNIAYTIFLENIAVRIGFIATAITAANLGTDLFAAHNAAMQFLSLSFSFGDGMQVAAVALTGRALGAEKPDLAFKYANVAQRIGFAMSLILSLGYILFGKQMMGLFFNESHIIEVGHILLNFITVILLMQVSQIIYGGALRAGGDVKFTLLASILSVTIVRTSVTLITVHIFKLGIIGIWLGIAADQFVRIVLLRSRFKKGYWTKIKI